MNILHKIATIGLLFLSLNLSGQELKVVNTKDLIPIARNLGLDSALEVAKSGTFPVFYVDPGVAKQLAKLSRTATPSPRIEDFLVQYALHTHDNKKLPHILHDYFNNKKALIQGYDPKNYPNESPKIDQNALFALIENRTKKTESLLIEYYKEWDKKSKEYYSDYVQGQSETYPPKKYQLMHPYEDCNYNCFVILLALERLGSGFCNQERLERHQNNMEPHLKGGFKISKSTDFNSFNDSNIASESIQLSKAYKSIGEIDFENEPYFQKLFGQYDRSYCWKLILYNGCIGFMDLGCQSNFNSGSGEIYRVELKKDKLINYAVKVWIS